MSDDPAKRRIETIEVSLIARSKTGRYYATDSLRERLETLDGTLFRGPEGTWYLRTTRPGYDGPPQAIVIVFELAGPTATIVSQTTGHYDWSRYEHVQDPPFVFPSE